MSKEEKYDATIFDKLIGKRCIVRDNMAGVFFGILLEVRASGVILGGRPRQIHYWDRGGSVAQIANAGIGGKDSRVTAPAEEGTGYAFQAANIVQILPMSDIAWERCSEFPAWTGGQ